MNTMVISVEVMGVVPMEHAGVERLGRVVGRAMNLAHWLWGQGRTLCASLSKQKHVAKLLQAGRQYRESVRERKQWQSALHDARHLAEVSRTMTQQARTREDA